MTPSHSLNPVGYLHKKIQVHAIRGNAVYAQDPISENFRPFSQENGVVESRLMTLEPMAPPFRTYMLSR